MSSLGGIAMNEFEVNKKAIRIDALKCIGCGLCIRLCTQLFIMGENKTAKCQTEVVSGILLKEAENIAFQCPGSAIKLSEE